MGFFTYLLRDLEQILFPHRDQHAIPSMDGGYTPNDRLDALSPIGASIPGADDVVEGGDGALYVSAGRQVLRLAGDGYEARSVFAELRRQGRRTCLSSRWSAAGLRRRPRSRCGRPWRSADPGSIRSTTSRCNCLTGVAAAPDGSIFVTDGSSRHPREDWVRDLMEKNHLGRLVGCGAGLDGAKSLLRDLYYPHGVAIAADGRTLWFTESWKHRISRAAISGRGIGEPQTVDRQHARISRRDSATAPPAASGSASSPCARIWSSSCCARTISARR